MDAGATLRISSWIADAAAGTSLPQSVKKCVKSHRRWYARLFELLLNGGLDLLLDSGRDVRCEVGGIQTVAAGKRGQLTFEVLLEPVDQPIFGLQR